MLTVYLLRHGETAMNADGNRYCGRSDVPLNARGVEQAEALANQLQHLHWDAVYASPLERAWHTAEIASAGERVIRDARLTEIDFGSWEGKTRAEFIAAGPEIWDQWNARPETTPAGGSGETAGAVIERLESFFQEMLRKYDGKTLLVAGHNGINRLYMAHMLGMPLKHYRRIFQDNASITQFILNGQEPFQLRHLNCR